MLYLIQHNIVRGQSRVDTLSQKVGSREATAVSDWREDAFLNFSASSSPAAQSQTTSRSEEGSSPSYLSVAELDARDTGSLPFQPRPKMSEGSVCPVLCAVNCISYVLPTYLRTSSSYEELAPKGRILWPLECAKPFYHALPCQTIPTKLHTFSLPC